MQTFKEFLETKELTERAVTHDGYDLMRTGKYDPRVKGSEDRFVNDLVAKGHHPAHARMTWHSSKNDHPRPDKAPAAEKPSHGSAAAQKTNFCAVS